MKGTAVACLAIAAATLSWPAGAGAAAADGACPAGGAWLHVVLSGDAFTPALRARVVEQLGADSRGHGVTLCDDAGAGTSAPLAEIALALSAASVLSLDVRDTVTDKRMTRDLPLRSVPPDALALAIALAAEELLRASWIEAALAPPPSPAGPAGAHPVPAVVREVNAEELARIAMAPGDVHGDARGARVQAALLGAVERATGGQTDLGADLRLAWGGRVAVGARGGFRVAPAIESAHGTVHGHVLLAGVGVAVSLVPRDAPWGGEVGARVDLLDVQFSGDATAPGTTAASGSAFGVVAGGVLGGWGRLGGPWRLVAEASLGAPLRAVTASDTGSAATGVSGVSIGGAVGVATTLPE